MIRILVPRLASASVIALALAAPIAISPMLASPAHALFGFGRIVYDPTNHAENLLTAARSLEQINNQIQQLQNEAQMLMNQARNLAKLDFNIVNRLRSTLPLDHTVARLGGDEFAVLALKTDYAAAAELLARMRQAIEALPAAQRTAFKADADPSVPTTIP